MRVVKWAGSIALSTIAVAACYGLACGNEESSEQRPVETVAAAPAPAPAAEAPEPVVVDEGEEAQHQPSPEPPETPSMEEGQSESEERSPTTSEMSPESDEGEASALASSAQDAPLGAELVATEGLRLGRMVMATGVEEREPVGMGTSFRSAQAERIYAFMEFENPDREERDVSVAWAPAEAPDEERSRVTVHVGSQRRWRTWAYTSLLRRPGRYVAIVRDQEERVIARTLFEVIE